jgi:hypothetical protein
LAVSYLVFQGETGPDFTVIVLLEPSGRLANLSSFTEATDSKRLEAEQAVSRQLSAISVHPRLDFLRESIVIFLLLWECQLLTKNIAL